MSVTVEKGNSYTKPVQQANQQYLVMWDTKGVLHF